MATLALRSGDWRLGRHRPIVQASSRPLTHANSPQLWTRGEFIGDMLAAHGHWAGDMRDPQSPAWHHLRSFGAPSLFSAVLRGTHAAAAHPGACAGPPALLHAAAEFALARPADRAALAAAAGGLAALWGALREDHALGRRAAEADAAPFAPVEASAAFAVASRATAAAWWPPEPPSPAAAAGGDAAVEAAASRVAPTAGLRLLSAVASPSGPAGFAVIRPARSSAGGGGPLRWWLAAPPTHHQPAAAGDNATQPPAPAYADGVPSFWLHPAVAARLAARSLRRAVLLQQRRGGAEVEWEDVAGVACRAVADLLDADWCAHGPPARLQHDAVDCLQSASII